MQLSDLFTLFRQEADDTVQPYLWDDDELLDFANDAQDEACRRARLLVDSSTPEVTSLPVLAAENGLLDLDERIIFIRRARLSGRAALLRMNMQDMENWNPLWQDMLAGTPTMFITDYTTGKLLLWPKPDADTTLLLTVVRTPMVVMDSPDATPEIAPRHHRSLRFWMLYRAYSKHDSEARDEKKAAENLALFEQEFGKKSAAIDEAWIEREQTIMDGTF